MKDFFKKSKKGESKMQKQIVVYSKNLAYTLRQMGFKIIDVGINEKFPQFDTYIFENTRELNEIIYKLTNKGDNKHAKICKLENSGTCSKSSTE